MNFNSNFIGSNEEENSFCVNQSFLLNCTHYLCQDCLSTVNWKAIKCKLCGMITNFERKNIDQFLLELEKQTIRQMEKLKDGLSISKESILNKIQYLSEEIEIRVESIKIELDELKKGLVCKLEKSGDNLINFFNNKYSNRVNQFDNLLNEIRTIIENQVNRNEIELKKLQSELKKVNETSEEQNFSKYRKLQADIIGKIVYNNFQIQNRFDKKIEQSLVGIDKSTEIRNIIKNDDYDLIELNVRPYDLIISPINNQLISTNPEDHCITIFDENFNLIKRIESIDNKFPFCPKGLAINDRNDIYITDSNRVIMTNIDFKRIKQFGTDQRGNEFNTLGHPEGICYDNDCLYICDFKNKRIQILTKDLDYIQTLSIDFQPYSIRISDKTLCVSGFNTFGSICFYDLEKLELKKTCTCIRYSKISELNGNFFIHSFPGKEITCFNSNGDQIDKIKLEKFSTYRSTSQYDGCLLIFKNDLLITFHEKKVLIKIKIK